MKYNIKNESIEYSGYLKILKANIEHDAFDTNVRISVTREACHRGNSSAILLLEKETNKFIFTNQFRYPTTKENNGWITEIVAGNIEANETAEESIIREVEEEIGYTIKSVEKLGSFYVSPGRSTEQIFLFYSAVSINDKTKPGGGVYIEKESIETIKYTVNEVKAMLLENKFSDAKTIIALLKFFMKN